MAARASKGQLRAVELHWRELIKEQYSINVAPFTVVDRRNLKHMLSAFEIAEVLYLLEGAIKFWPSLRRESYMAKIAPTPVFRDFFWHREHIQSFLATEEGRRRKEREFHQKYAHPAKAPHEEVVVVDEAPASALPEMKLSEMVEAARAQLRKEKSVKKEEMDNGGR